MHIKAVFRFGISIFSAVVGALGVYVATQNLAFSFISAWNIFTLFLVLLSVREFVAVKKDRIKELVASEDDSTWLLFGVVITACIVSLIMLVGQFSGSSEIFEGFGKLFSIIAVALSWILLHTSFTFRYAHMYYGDKNDRYSKTTRGLDFPGKEDPDYFDFAYFSFVLGMTFQVSDIVIVSKPVRRLALLHSLIAFVFNTVIVALTVSQLIR